MDGTFNYGEYVVTQKKEGRNKRHRALLLCLYFLFGFSFSVVFLALKLVPVIAIMPLLLWIIVHFTWKYVNVEYKYTIEKGEISFFKVYSASDEKKVLAFKLADAHTVLPLSTADAAIADYAPERTIDFRGTVKAVNVAAVLVEIDRRKIAVYFETCKKTVSLINLYCKQSMLSAL